MLRSRETPTPGPTYMSEDQKGQQSPMSYFDLPRTPPPPSRLRQCTAAEDTSLRHVPTVEYLHGLRQNKVARPSGSRPPPPSKYAHLRRAETQANMTEQSHDGRPSLPTTSSMPIMPTKKHKHMRTDSTSTEKDPFAGRPIVRQPSIIQDEEEALKPADDHPMKRIPSMTYMERGTRWMEKQEARSLRTALDDMDSQSEKKVHEAAQDEASELVWKHQNAELSSAGRNAPYRNPDVQKDYRSHLRKGSYQRSHGQDVGLSTGQRSASGGSQDSTNGTSVVGKRKSMDVLRKTSPPSAIVGVEKTRRVSSKSYNGLAEAVADDIAKAHRRVSSGAKRIMSGETKVYMHPNDRIWEDPQEAADGAFTPQARIVDPPKLPAPEPSQPYVRKNPFARIKVQAERLERSRSEPIVNTAAMHHSVEIQRNAPSQSRRPWYMSNEPLPPTPPSPCGQPPDDVSPKVTPTKEGKEIRSDDIRSATSKQRKDYSPKLPRPTVVSDKPGRPIVSFKQDWKPREVELEGVQAPALAKTDAASPNTRNVSKRDSVATTVQEVPQICLNDDTRAPIPTISIPDEVVVPTIVLPEEPDFTNASPAPMAPEINIEPPKMSVQPPQISVNGPEKSSPRTGSVAQRPLPDRARPPLNHAATAPVPQSKPHCTPYARQSNVLCAHCALPIAGRILSAAGERFHPGCFVCNQCHTSLELVAFYPEPEQKRDERLDRITARQSGIVPEGMTEEELYRLEYRDGDATPRFFCHLDFHELFSPRCKSCKTPIEGEVIVACGAEWHAGHFFCAQCGDPFDSLTPFVEKDGYAWCVGCHTNRYSSKCRKCKKPVVDTVIKALGHDWHADCFVCMECNGGFQDGRYFLRGSSQDPVCVKCEERRLKA